MCGILWNYAELILPYLWCRYRRRRSRSRSISRSPGNYRGRYKEGSHSRSPIRSPSPVDKRPLVSDRLKSRLGPRIDHQRSPDKGGMRSRSEESSRSRSSDATPPKHRNTASAVSPRRSRSSSPSGQRGLVSYGDISPESWDEKVFTWRLGQWREAFLPSCKLRWLNS